MVRFPLFVDGCGSLVLLMLAACITSAVTQEDRVTERIRSGSRPPGKAQGA